MFDFNFFLALITGILLPAIIAFSTVLITRVNEKGKNVLAVTTNVRIQRNEQLKEAGILLMSNTTPRLLSIPFDKKMEMLQNATHANSIIGVILHRNFEYDVLLIRLAEEICDLAFCIAYAEKDPQREEELVELISLIEQRRQRFSFELDLYTNTDWYRIKKETSGKETASAEWFALNKKLRETYPKEYMLEKKE